MKKNQFNEDLFSLTLTHGSGSHVWSISGKEYIDFMCSWGTNILGYSHPAVNKAVTDQLEKGVLFSQKNPLRDKLLEKLIKIYPSAQQGLIMKTGSEGTTAAIRIARACTGKDKIIRCGYHGWHDWCNFGRGTTHPDDRPAYGYEIDLPGIPNSIRNLTKEFIDPNKVEILENYLKMYNNEIAGIIIDPTEVTPPIKETLQAIQSLTEQYGIIFILDEIKTCFRLSLGGAQEYYNLTPDITILSKAISNGLPIAIVLGKEEIMKKNYAYIGGTYEDETLAIAASLATINTIEKEGGIKHVWKMGNRLIEGLERAITDIGIEEEVEAHPWNEPPMPFIKFKGSNRSHLRSIFFREIFNQGLLMYHDHMNFINLSHTQSDIDRTIDKCKICLKKVKNKLK